MPRPFSVQEINPKTYNPNIYYSALDAEQQRKSQNAISKNKKNAKKLSSSRSAKRINYSLADLEAKLYTSQNRNGEDIDKSQTEKINKFTETELIRSKRRFMELDTENIKDISDVPMLLSTTSGITRDRIDNVTTALSSTADGNGASGSSTSARGSSNIRFEIPSSVYMSYKSTKLPKSQDQRKKSSTRTIALRKTMSSKRKLHTYLDTLDQVSKSVIFHNVYNKKYFKVLPLITICSICGGYDSLSNCVACGDKICSVNCFKVHNETRCTGR
ncbi:Vacuolar protein sorting-associated protein 71 [Nakaseomyces bracarensis]|uniref:Vacuolar protein sorting-associated protein 71 n=1 Tax=Nakaseomyces bracarensis TaxID=273131 RepID=A0ABR4NQA0_9SACH